MFKALTRPPARRLFARALPLVAFVAAPLTIMTALATPNITGTALPGTLTAVYPAAISFGNATAGAPVNLAFSVTGGAIVVSDNRGSTGGTWSTTASMSNFSTVVASSNSIPSSSVSMSPGSVIAAATNPSGTSASAGGNNQEFATPTTVVSFMSGTGAGQGTYGLNPTFTWAVPANAAAAATVGTAYQATITFTTQ